MTQPCRPSGRGLLMWPGAVLLMIAAAGYVPTQRLAGTPGVEAMLVALSIVLGSVYATLLPAMRRMASAEQPAERFKAAFRAGLERFVLTLVLAGAIGLQTGIRTRPFLVWIAVSYVIMIKVETLVLIGWAKRFESRA